MEHNDNRFNANAICVKCDSKDINAKYCGKGSDISYGKDYIYRPLEDRVYCSQIDHFERTCNYCGFRWIEYAVYITDEEINNYTIKMKMKIKNDHVGLWERIKRYLTLKGD